MEHAATATPCPASPDDPQPDRPGRTMPARIAALLHTVRILLGFGRHLAETAKDRSASPDFNAVAACFGTGRLYAILAHLQRGLLRAAALERVLLAARGAGPGYPLHRTAQARDRDTGRASRSAGSRSAGRAAGRPPGDRPPSNRADAPAEQPAEAPIARKAPAIPPVRLERPRTVHADPGGTRGAGAPPPARPHPGRYLPRPGGGARLLHRSVLERRCSTASACSAAASPP